MEKWVCWVCLKDRWRGTGRPRPINEGGRSKAKSQIDPGGVKNRSWEGLGEVLEDFSGKDRKMKRGRRFLDLLRPSFLGESFGLQNGTKIVQKLLQKSIEMLMPLGIDF